ncbi:MAG: hypothetical protein E6Q39_00060 [Crocinitomicaceae bacterium]|nr:MAG: hypothetical protein E6Q39_00060 [Crocinitomicaceae bacterium]
MKFKFFFESAPAVVQQAIINCVFGRKTETQACEIIKVHSPGHLFLSKRFFGNIRLIKSQDKKTIARMQSDYTKGIKLIANDFFPKVGLIKKLIHYKKYSRLSKAGSYSIMILEKRLIIKYLDCKL